MEVIVIKYRYFPPVNFRDPSVWKTMKQKCFDGSIDYESFPANEYKYFDKLRILYLKYQSGSIGREEAEREEQLIYNDYVRERERIEAELRVYQIYNRNRLRFSGLKVRINKARSPEEKLRYALELIGQLTNDDLFVKINRR